jgi:hypothetical protein
MILFAVRLDRGVECEEGESSLCGEEGWVTRGGKEEEEEAADEGSLGARI